MIVLDFTGAISSQDVSSSYRRHHKKYEGSASVNFDLSQASFIEPLAMNLLLRWTAHLAERNKLVIVNFPSPDQMESSKYIKIRAYLRRCGFANILEELGVQVSSKDAYTTFDSRTDDSGISHIPYTKYADEKDFDSFLAALEVQKNLQTIFKDSVKLELIGSGGLRSII